MALAQQPDRFNPIKCPAYRASFGGCRISTLEIGDDEGEDVGGHHWSLAVVIGCPTSVSEENASV